MGRCKFVSYSNEELKSLVEENWRYLDKIPKNKITKSMCKVAIKQCYLALRYVPDKFLDEDIYEFAIKCNWETISIIQPKAIIKKYCELAFSINCESIKYIPKRFKTNKMCLEAIDTDWTLLEHCNDNTFNIDNCINVLRRIIDTENINKLDTDKQECLFRIIKKINEKAFESNEIMNLLNTLRNYNVISKRYDKDINKFIITRQVFDEMDNEIIEFDKFDDFYNYLNGDLKETDIYEYDFKGVDLKNYNIQYVNIKSDILESQGLYDDTFYSENIKNLNDLETIVPIKNEKKKSISILHDDDIKEYSLADSMYKFNFVYYISDIHLDYKISKRFKERATKLEIENYISYIVDKMLKDIRKIPYYKYLLIAGDVSNSYEISKMFYTELVNKDKFLPEQIITILGNHEYWNDDLKTKSNVQDITALYRKLFKELGITFLQDDLLLFNPKRKIISKEQLMKMTPNEIQKECLESKVTILGGTGFSGFNPKFNANALIYAMTITNIDEDKKLTNEFLEMYKKLKAAIPTKNMIVLTHNPKQDWSADNYNANWIYVNGHTHMNEYYKDEEKTLYADNQIGYFNEEVCIKKIDFSIKCNIFEYYKDGIYDIDCDTYKRFYNKIGNAITCSLNDGKIYLLKCAGNYMFLYKGNNDRLYLLNGGVRNKLDNQNIDYYYNNLPIYADTLRTKMKSYYDYIKKVSTYVKAFGGSGNIHGAIVDIDFYNHLYVNVYDGKITPYWALSMTDKIFYKDLKGLLKENCPKLLKKYEQNNKNNQGLQIINNGITNKNKIYSSDTRMYKESRILKRIQLLVEDNIIKIWRDSILTNENIDNILEEIDRKLLGN